MDGGRVKTLDREELSPLVDSILPVFVFASSI
jgi:hypothetical protein